MKPSHILPFILTSFTGVKARTFTVTNNCPFTVWPAIFTDPNVGSDIPAYPTGWEAPPSSSVNFIVPDTWKSGRIWGRRDCDFSTNSTTDSCAVGSCTGGLVCEGTGSTPATLAEWTLQPPGGQDFYDVSLVDGYNLPIRIDNNQGCGVADCPIDLGSNCPTVLQGPFNSTGSAVGCKSACGADIGGSASCCTGKHSTPNKCPSSGVKYYDYFKENCPNAYAYAYDESSGTALWTCNSTLNADYTLTFCPSVDGVVFGPSVPNQGLRTTFSAVFLALLVLIITWIR